MGKLPAILLLACGFAAAEPAHFTVKELPKSRMTDARRYEFKGHFGESFVFDEGWIVKSDLREGAEIIRLHREQVLYKKDLYKKFEPTEESWIPERFTEDDLIQIEIRPKAKGEGDEALVRFRLARLESYRARGAVDIAVAPGTKVQGWEPPGTSAVFIDTPFCLRETYSQSPKHFIVITAGCRSEWHAYFFIRRRILDWAEEGWPSDSWSRRGLRLLTHPFVSAVLLLTVVICVKPIMDLRRGRGDAAAARAGFWGLVCGAGGAAAAATSAGVFAYAEPLATDSIGDIQAGIIVVSLSALVVLLRRKLPLKTALRLVVPWSLFAVAFWNYVPVMPMMLVEAFDLAVIGAFFCGATSAALGYFWGKRAPAA